MGILRFVIGGTTKLTGKATKLAMTGTGKLVSKKFPETGEYLAEVGHAIVDSSVAAIDTGAQFTEGTIQTVYGAVAKKSDIRNAGFQNLKEPVERTAKGIGQAGLYGIKNISGTGIGILTGDVAKTKQASKNLVKMSAVILAGYSVIDQVIENSATLVQSTDIFTGELHPVSGIPYEKNEVLYNGFLYEGNFPVFPVEFEATLSPDNYLMSDASHIQEANQQLYLAIQKNMEIAVALNFDYQDIQNLQTSTTPVGFDWHHHEEPGRIQLVDEELHQQTGHIGGRSIWGGGTDYR